MSKILIHGATNWGSSNFGDVIYVHQIARRVLDHPHVKSVQIAEPSEFISKAVPFATSDGVSLANADALVYVPGGYFGEGHAARLRDNVIHFLRFFPVGLRAIIKKIPIAVIGIGAGPIKSPLLKMPIKAICAHADVVVVRDHESYLALERIGVSDIVESFDPILSIDFEKNRKENETIRELRRAFPGKKFIFVHFNHSELASNVFGEAVANFLKTNPEYVALTGFDQEFKDPNERLAPFLRHVPTAQVVDYSDPYELVDVLGECNLVLTCKLHVGVVAAMLGKSVVCVAEHPEKSRRFYDAIGEHERCVSLYEMGVDGVESRLRRYRNVPIGIPEELYGRANVSWEQLDAFLDAIE